LTPFVRRDERPHERFEPVLVPAVSPKYGLATFRRDPYAPPISEPHSTPGHLSGADAILALQKGNDHMGSMAVNELGPMLTATEVAEMLHLHVNTVKRLGDRGELPFYRVCKRGDRRFRLDDVMRFLAQNR
jgi:excisionase family DNA binding protein